VAEVRPGADLAWVERARAVSLRRLEDDVAAAVAAPTNARPAAIGFRHSHHIRFRSAGGPDEPWNRTTLCAFHHHRGVHAGSVRIAGRAPDGLLFELGGER
jgi:hypothetical protein